MILEYAENIIQFLTILISLLLCLFGYIESRRKIWLHAAIFFVGNLLSSYFWSAYFVIMRATPNTNNGFTYLGWDIGFLALLGLVFLMKSREEIRYFNPFMLLPVALNVWQLILYLPFGGVINSIYQVTVCTGIACLSLQGILWYLRERKDKNIKPPLVQISTLLLVAFEFGMWTSSCFGGWIGILYYLFSILSSMCNLLLVWSINRIYGRGKEKSDIPVDTKFQAFLKTIYLILAVISSLGGILLGLWIRDTLTRAITRSSEYSVYDIIPVILFLVSLVIAGAAIAIIMLVYFEQKVVENNRLREARNIAERSNEAKSDFLASMSHEIRTPINAVLGMNEMVLKESIRNRDKLPEDREILKKVFDDITGYAGNIESAGNNLLAIINDILDLSKIEAGKLEIREAGYELSSVLNDVSNMITFRAKEKGLEYRVEVDETLPDGLRGDEVRIRQVITNVLNNAVKYTKEGFVSLSVSCRDGEDYVNGEIIDLVFAVKDTGIGIKEEDIGRLFDKFERMDVKRNKGIEGTGLGLAITQRLIQLMGGSVKVESTYGLGSVFTITIPQEIVTTEPIGNFQEKFAKSLKDADGGNEVFRAPYAHILVVDDTRMNLMVAEGLLRDTGIEIDTAASGAEAICLADVVRYDIILMDQRMPEMDGTEAMHRIREQEDSRNRETPIICLTADALSGARERYVSEGFTDYLSKPIDSRELKDTLMKYLPKEKITYTAEDDAPAGDVIVNTADGYSVLRSGGIDPEAGLKYSQNDKSFYKMLLEEYKRSAGEKKDSIIRYYEEKDWKNYCVLVHGLKSSSRLIGADALADAAAAMEQAAHDEDENAINKGHSDMIAQFDAAVDAVKLGVFAMEAELA